MPADPLLLAELVALLADGQEVISEQAAQPFGVAAQLGIVKGPRKLKDVISHGVHPARRPALFRTA